MSRRAKVRLEQVSRLMGEAETAQLLAMSAGEFSRRSATLERQLGMPKRHPVLRKRDRVAIHQWLDGLYGTSAKTSNVSDLIRERMGALVDGNRAH